MIAKIENYEKTKLNNKKLNIANITELRFDFNTMLLSLMTYQTSWLRYIAIKSKFLILCRT